MSTLPRCLMLLALALFSFQALAQEQEAVLPDSLGKWYKPQNKRQVWLHTMFAMRRELQALQEYADEGDLSGVKKWSDKLIKHYRRIPEMVPEWQDELELETATGLETAVANADLARVKSLSRDLARSCKGCHRDFRVLAALRYRTPVFNDVMVSENGQQIKFLEFKHELIRTLNRINISVQDARWENAAVALEQFQSKLGAYGDSCASCHDDKEPRERILGAATTAGLEHLKQAIQRQDQKDSGSSLGETAVNVCARCHGVHRTLTEIRQQLFGAD